MSFMEKEMSQVRAMIGCAAAPAAVCRDRIEERIIRAYVQLALAPDQAGGHRTISVAHFGAIEVRLTELSSINGFSPIPRFWVEVYSHQKGCVVESCGCFEFDEDELNTVVELVLDARENQPSLN